MRVVDSSAWIEWFTGTPVGDTLIDDIPHPDACIVPTIVQLELAKWMTCEKGRDIADRVIAYTMKCHVAPLDTATALLAAEVSKTYKLDMADAIVYATSVEYAADLLTCDAHFKGLPHVLYFIK